MPLIALLILLGIIAPIVQVTVLAPLQFLTDFLNWPWLFGGILLLLASWCFGR